MILTNECASQIDSLSFLLKGGDKIRPVLCDGSYEFLDPNDYEILFGFPEHFTDCGLTTTTRIKVIGKSWCVPVIESLLEPLKSFFRKNSKS